MFGKGMFVGGLTVALGKFSTPLPPGKLSEGYGKVSGVMFVQSWHVSFYVNFPRGICQGSVTDQSRRPPELLGLLPTDVVK